MKPIICSVDGNIAVGKSTLLQEIKLKGYYVLEEDLSDWGDILSFFYQNQKRWMFTLQIAILNSMYKQYIKIQNLTTKPKNNIVFIERSPCASMIFVEIGKKEGYIINEEYDIIKKLYETLKWESDLNVYLQSSVKECFSRLKKRNRICEQNVTELYLQMIQNEYDFVYTQLKNKGRPVITLNGFNPIDELITELNLPTLNLSTLNKLQDVAYLGHIVTNDMINTVTKAEKDEKDDARENTHCINSINLNICTK